VIRVATPVEVNAIANHPDVQERMGAGEMDFTQALADERCVGLVYKGFCGLFVWSSPGIYEGHVMACPGDRGRVAIDLALQAFEWMKGMGAKTIWAQPSVNNRAALWYVNTLGMVPCGKGTHPIVGDVRYFLKDL